jgi:hypothetical protein
MERGVHYIVIAFQMYAGQAGAFFILLAGGVYGAMTGLIAAQLSAR